MLKDKMIKNESELKNVEKASNEILSMLENKINKELKNDGLIVKNIDFSYTGKDLSLDDINIYLIYN